MKNPFLKVQPLKRVAKEALRNWGKESDGRGQGLTSTGGVCHFQLLRQWYANKRATRIGKAGKREENLAK